MDYIKWIRSRVGTRKIFLVFGTVVVRDDNGRVLLQRRTDFDFWGLPGGALELNESVARCARREVREETGLELGPLRLTGVYSDPRYDVVYPNGDQAQQFSVVFTARATGGKMQVDGVETSAQRFFAVDELDALDVPLWYRDMIRDALRDSAEPAFLPPDAQVHTRDQIAQIRPFVGNERFIGVGAMAVVVRDDGALLMIQRSDNGAWIFPSGFCDLGENVAYTAVRETREETGLDIDIVRMLGVYSSPDFHHTYDNGHQIKNVGVAFLARPRSGPVQPNPSEVADWAWLLPAAGAARITPWFAHYYERMQTALAGGPLVVA